ncbi:hypothetical protein KRR38_25120 [Novosphingobium sp. G106]|nr:hypothetical protein [Novosphingobium sp. G106]MBV1690870.1 hypothetical protein [Novosphingobium sp. G106]
MQNNIKLGDGDAVPMGDGVFVVCQRDERGVPHSVVITRGDLERLLAAEA